MITRSIGDASLSIVFLAMALAQGFAAVHVASELGAFGIVIACAIAPAALFLLLMSVAFLVMED